MPIISFTDSLFGETLFLGDVNTVVNRGGAVIMIILVLCVGPFWGYLIFSTIHYL